MKIATFNVNGVDGRLPRLLEWLEASRPDVACLQEIKTGDATFPAKDFNVVPTRADIYNAWLWRFDAVLQPETQAAYRRLLAQGWIDATRHVHPSERVYTFWVNADAFAAMPASGWTSCCSALPSRSGWPAPRSTSSSAAAPSRATTHRCGSSSPARPERLRHGPGGPTRPLRHEPSSRTWRRSRHPVKQ